MPRHSVFCTAAVAFALLLCWVAPRPASAQAAPDPYAIIPITDRDHHLDEVLRLAVATQAQLESRELTYIPLDSARTTFERNHSREPRPARKEDINLLLDAGNAALVAVADGDWKKAQEQLRIVQEKGARALESANRSYNLASRVFHACLLAVQGLADNGNELEAKRQATDCLAHSPGLDLAPDNRDYPPYVHKILAEAKAALADAKTAPIVVESHPSGCRVYLNGTLLGTTPYRQANPARRPYFAQVECEPEGEGDSKPGRVHTILPGDETPTLVVDTTFENAVATSNGVLRLRYDSVDNPRQRKHVQAILDALRAPAAFTIRRDHTRLVLAVVAPGRPTRSVQLRTNFTALELTTAVDDLLAASETAPSLVAEASLPDAADALAASNDDTRTELRKRRTQLGLGAVLSAAGAATWVASWVMYAKHVDDGLAYRINVPSDPTHLRAQQTWLDSRPPPYALSAVAVASLTPGALLLLQAQRPERLPWWAFGTVTGVGAGLAAWGAADIARGGPCGATTRPDRRECVLDQERRDRGALVLMTALPALLIPPLHLALAKRAKKRPVAILPAFTARSASMHVALSL